MKPFRVLHLFGGIGGGALGFKRAKFGPGRFENLTGVDVCPAACADFERLTGTPARVADIARMTVAELHAATGGIAPDVVFTSPPCKGFSGLLSNARANTEKYAALNRLVFQGLFLVLEAFPPPKLILLENVPRIASRGAELLLQVRQLLSAYGYVFDERTHDCGELGGLSQHRKRYLLIARHAASLQTFVYQPPPQRVRSIGECLEHLPLPDDPSAGPMHRLPRLQWRTLVRLALIPAGGDWRAIGTKDGARFNNVYRIVPWSDPSVAVTGGGGPSSGGINVADPRFEPGTDWRRNVYRVVRWDQAIGTVTGSASPSTGPFSVADPRFGCSPDAHRNKYRVSDWDEAAHCITGADRVGSGAPSVADPRFGCESRPNLYAVMPWEEPAKTVTGSASVSGSNGAAAVADPRLGIVHGAPSVDPRLPDDDARPDPPPVIISEDGTWHRPLTTLELAALQGFPVEDLMRATLEGASHTKWRERIGNAVPPPAAEAIAGEILRSLVAAADGDTFMLGGTDVWVQP